MRCRSTSLVGSDAGGSGDGVQAFSKSLLIGSSAIDAWYIACNGIDRCCYVQGPNLQSFRQPPAPMPLQTLFNPLDPFPALLNILSSLCKLCRPRVLHALRASHARHHFRTYFPPLSLPVELWEVVIDFVGADSHEETRARTLRACSLTCRAWVHRARFHLGPALITRQTIISSPEYISATRPILMMFPNVGDNVISLSLDASPDGDSSWMSSAVMCLGPKMKRVENLTLRGFDFSTRHPGFYRSCSLFRPLKWLWLVFPRYSCFSDIAHLVHATSAARVDVWLRAPDLSLNPATHAVRERQVVPQTGRIRYPLGFVDMFGIETIPWEHMGAVCRGWVHFTSSLGSQLSLSLTTHWDCSPDHVFTEGDREVWSATAGLLQRGATHTSDASWVVDTGLVRVSIDRTAYNSTSHPLLLIYGPLLTLATERTCLLLRIMVDDLSDPRQHLLPAILSPLSQCTFDTLVILACIPNDYRSAVRPNYVPRWESVKDSLAEPAFADLKLDEGERPDEGRLLPSWDPVAYPTKYSYAMGR